MPFVVRVESISCISCDPATLTNTQFKKNCYMFFFFPKNGSAVLIWVLDWRCVASTSFSGCWDGVEFTKEALEIFPQMRKMIDEKETWRQSEPEWRGGNNLLHKRESPDPLSKNPLSLVGTRLKLWTLLWGSNVKDLNLSLLITFILMIYHRILT